jgi:hypothetical protein
VYLRSLILRGVVLRYWVSGARGFETFLDISMLEVEDTTSLRNVGQKYSSDVVSHAMGKETSTDITI